MLPCLQSVGCLGGELWIQRNHRYKGLTINYVWILDCVEGWCPNPCIIVQGSTMMPNTIQNAEQVGSGGGWSGKASLGRYYLNKVPDEVWELDEQLFG